MCATFKSFQGHGSGVRARGSRFRHQHSQLKGSQAGSLRKDSLWLRPWRVDEAEIDGPRILHKVHKSAGEKPWLSSQNTHFMRRKSQLQALLFPARGLRDLLSVYCAATNMQFELTRVLDDHTSFHLSSLGFKRSITSGLEDPWHLQLKGQDLSLAMSLKSYSQLENTKIARLPV